MKKEHVINNPILVDLSNTLEERVRTAIKDYIVLCHTADVDKKEAYSVLVSTVMLCASALAAITEVPEEKFAKMFAHMVKDKRKDIKDIKEKLVQGLMQ